MDYRLSKSKYLTGLNCTKALWLTIRDPDKGAPPSPAQEYIFEQGTRVGLLAQGRFPGGRLVSSPSYRAPTALKQTRALMEAGAPALFEAAFFYENILVRVDVLRRANADLESDSRRRRRQVAPTRGSDQPCPPGIDLPAAWDLIEVKSSTALKPEHLPDAAVQRYVLQGCGVPLHKVFLMHLNPECTYPDLSNLFVLEDLTDLLGEPTRGIPSFLEAFRQVLKRRREPIVPIGSQCTSPYRCPFIPWCWRKVPRVSIFNIPRLGAERKAELVRRNILRIEDLPASIDLSAAQSRFVELYRGGTPQIQWRAIRRELDSLRYPLYFLDFETDSPAVPRYPGTRPYQKIPFQYACHRLETDGSLSHNEYLHTVAEDPRPELARALLDGIGLEGSLVVYNAPFERSVLEALADVLPWWARELNGMVERLWDLLEIFRRYYQDPAFGGSNSIKNVLPVLVPKLSYEALEVQDGTEAQAAWNRMLASKSLPQRKRLEAALRTYCRQDSLAMVEIFRVLRRRLDEERS
jgi:hypothetical protein